MPDMPMPPMPTKWIGPTSSGSFVADFIRVYHSSYYAILGVCFDGG
jgi:hypothetical protein